MTWMLPGNLPHTLQAGLIHSFSDIKKASEKLAFLSGVDRELEQQPTRIRNHTHEVSEEATGIGTVNCAVIVGQ